MKKTFRAGDYQPDPERDLDEELENHLGLEVDDLVARGMSEEDAWSQVRRTHSSPTGRQGSASNRRAAVRHTQSRLRWEGLARVFDHVSRDLRYALRRMGQSPGFAMVAVLSLSLGIGANTAVFGVVNGLFFKPPPYSDPASLAGVWTGRENEIPTSDVTWSEFERLRQVEGVFTGVGGYDGTLTGLRDDEGTRSAFVETITSNLFPLMGIKPVLGRDFLPEEAFTPGRTPVAILGHRYWVEGFNQDPAVLGRTIHLSGIPFTIVGVAPPELSAFQTRTLETEVFVPLSMDQTLEGLDETGAVKAEWPHAVRPIVRLAPGVSLGVAEDRISGIVQEVREAEGRTASRDWRFRLWPLEHQAIEPGIDRGLTRVAWFIMAVAGMVLLLACTNLANLALSRGMARRRELAVRSAIGAGRRRLLAQLLMETLVHAGLGGVGGFFLAQWTLDLLFRFQPNIGITLVLDTAPDLRILAFSAAIVGLATVLFGFLPALAVTSRDVAPDLREKGTSGGTRFSRWRNGLVGFQMAVSVVLLIGSSLFYRSLLKAQDSDPGFVAEGAVNVQVDLSKSWVPEAQRTTVTEEIKRGVATLPEVAVVGVSDVVPLLNRNTTQIQIPGLEGPDGESSFTVSTYRVDDGYLGAMGIPVYSGRGISEADTREAGNVVLVNRAGASRLWPDQTALGRDIRIDETEYRVVGVVGDTKVTWLSDPPEPTIYLPLDPSSTSVVHLVVRSETASHTGLIGNIRRRVAAVGPDLLILEAQSFEDRVAINVFPFRLAAIYLGIFGVAALILAAIGLYGVVSLSVAQRTREMGIRISIGADPAGVVGMVLGKSLLPVAIGGMVGLALALALATLIRGFLFGAQPADPVTLGAVPAVLGLVALVAAFLPARKAGRVDPMETLRTE